MVLWCCWLGIKQYDVKEFRIHESEKLPNGVWTANRLWLASNEKRSQGFVGFCGISPDGAAIIRPTGSTIRTIVDKLMGGGPEEDLGTYYQLQIFTVADELTVEHTDFAMQLLSQARQRLIPKLVAPQYPSNQ